VGSEAQPAGCSGGLAAGEAGDLAQVGMRVWPQTVCAAVGTDGPGRPRQPWALGKDPREVPGADPGKGPEEPGKDPEEGSGTRPGDAPYAVASAADSHPSSQILPQSPPGTWPRMAPW